MALFDYKCGNCEYEMFDIYQKIKDKPKKRCPSCKKNKLERIINSAPIGFVGREATTFGQLAERNTKALGSAGRDKMEEEERDSKKKRRQMLRESGLLPKGVTVPEPTNGTGYTGTDLEKISKINKMTRKEKAKYIMTGDGL